MAVVAAFPKLLLSLVGLGASGPSQGETTGIDALTTALVIAALATILIVVVILIRRRRLHRKTVSVGQDE